MQIELQDGEMIIPGALAQEIVNALQIVTGLNWTATNGLIQRTMAADKNTQERKSAAAAPPTGPKLCEKVPEGM